MTQSLTKALLNIAAGGTVHLFKSCAGLNDCAVYRVSFWKKTDSDSPMVVRNIENLRKSFRRFRNRGLRALCLVQHPFRLGFSSTFAQLEQVSRRFADRLLGFGMQCDDSLHMPGESCVYLLAGDRPSVTSTSSLDEHPQSASTLTSFELSTVGIELTLLGLLGFGTQLLDQLDQLVQLFMITGIFGFTVNGLRGFHLNGGDIHLRSGRVKQLLHYPSPG